jgi:hypothetical protein
MSLYLTIHFPTSAILFCEHRMVEWQQYGVVLVVVWRLSVESPTRVSGPRRRRARGGEWLFDL